MEDESFVDHIDIPTIISNRRNFLGTIKARVPKAYYSKLMKTFMRNKCCITATVEIIDDGRLSVAIDDAPPMTFDDVESLNDFSFDMGIILPIKYVH